MILHAFWRSSASYRVRIGLAFKGLAYEVRPVPLREGGGAQHQPAFQALNPMRQVPVLEVDDDGPPFRLAQSIAILEYLEERFPSPPLLPEGRVARARVRQIVEAVNSGIQPFGNTGTQQYVESVLHADGDAWCRHWMTRGLEGLEATVRGTAGRFAFGDAVTLADVCIVPQMYFARRFALDFDAYPTLVRVEEACTALDAFRAAHPSRQVDAPA